MSTLQEQIEKFKNDYYSNNGGKKSSMNFTGKSRQKTDIAQKVSEQFSINQLLERTIYKLPGKNHIFIDYLIFKQYANEFNYEDIISYMLHIYDDCIETHGTFIVHVNLDSFSTTAAERYKNIIERFNSRFMQDEDTIYMRRMENMYIYYPPSMLQMIYTMLKPIMNPEVYTKTIVIPKNESGNKLKELFSTI
jgi:hypothetical protein